MTQRTSFVKTFLAAIFIVFSVDCFATHVQGGEITMSCLGGNQYELRLALYRDCAGINAPGSANITYSSASCGITQTVSLNRVANTGQEVTPICPTQVSQCAGGALPGVQEYVYTTIVTLPPCDDWVVSYTLNARNNAIVTIDNPGQQAMHIESKLDNLNFPCNNSPTFTNKPVPFVCVGQQYCFNNGANDIDGDSLYYQMVIPKNSPTGTVTYRPGYSPTQPLSSTPAVTIDASTGDICMTPTMVEVTVFAVLVEEWRNGVRVGEIRRDIQIRTIICNNNNPFLNGINNTGSYNMDACVGNPITFNIPSFDNDAGDSLYLSWNGGIPGATFNPGTGTRPQATFTWNPTLNDVSPIPHCFTVTVVDDNCPFLGTQSYSFCITVGGYITTTTKTDVLCSNTNGTASVSVASAPGPFSYLWNPGGQTTSSVTGLAEGSYTVTVTDSVGCSGVDTIVINSTNPAIASITSFTNVACNGDANGSITATLTGAGLLPPLTYSWLPAVAGNTNTANNLAPATYQTIITDSQGCVDTVTQVITEPLALSLNNSFINTGCYGGATGSAVATPSGGTPPYTYLWMPGAFNTASINSLSVGTYVVTVADSNNCMLVDSVTIDQPTELGLTEIINNANCGQADGSVTVTGSGGFPGPGYTFAWSNGQTGPTATNLVAGTYTVTITDANLCTKTFPITVGNNAGPTVQITSSSNVSCNGGNDGNITVVASGGQSPYTYLWSNGQVTPTASNLTIGLYSIVITDANGCSATIDTTITEPTQLTNNFITKDPLCFGGATGSISANPIGGIPPYSYVWAIAGSPANSTINNLAAGTYSVTISDANSCSITQMVTLVNPPTVNTLINATNVNCFGVCEGIAGTQITNGMPPYTYSWNDPLQQTTDTAKFLCAGTYQVSVVDGNGCVSQAVTTITEPTLLSATLTSQGNLDCYNECIGFAQVTATGGVAPYTYTWSNGGATATAAGLCAGSYSCTVTDANGCSSVVVATITQPKELIATTTGTDIKCFGICDGTGSIAFSGGTAPYSFLWTPGLQTINNPADLCVGQNISRVTDANGCFVTDTITLVSSIPALSAVPTISTSNCGQANGGACVSVSGGQAPYSYVWNDPSVSKTSCITNQKAGPYSVDITDANGCLRTEVVSINDVLGPSTSIISHTDLLCYGDTNGTVITGISAGTPPYTIAWSPGNQGIQNPTNLRGGTHTMTVTDVANCVSSVSVVILEPKEINSLIVSSNNVTCFNLCDGNATVSSTGGTGPHTYLWNDPGNQNIAAAINLCDGNYLVTTTDLNGCVKTNNVTITEPDELVIDSSSFKNLNCFQDNTGSIFTSVVGGTPFYTFNWTPNISSAPVANGLSSGNYSLQVVDQNGCTVNDNWTVTEPTLFSGIPTQIDATCGYDNGSATIAASGGTAPYFYQWNDPALQTTPTADSLLSGSYLVNVTDTNNCTFAQNFALLNIPGPSIDSVTSTAVNCFGGNVGTASVYLNSAMGTAPFTYVWNPVPQTLPNISGLSAGVYSVIVTDSNGCVVGGNATVTEPPLLELFTSLDDTICFGDTILIYGQASGGTMPYTYTWTGAPGLLQAGVNEVSPTATTTYTVSVEDMNGCTVGPMDITITVLPALNVISNDVAVCQGDSVLISALANGGNGSYVYSWDNGDTNQAQMVKPTLVSSPIDYIVTLDDGCSLPAYDTVTVTVNPLPIIDSIVTTDVLCYGDSTGTANVFIDTITSYQGPYTYDWGFVSQQNSLATGFSLGKYIVVITDNNGCSVRDSVVINQPDSLVLSVVGDSICYGATGQVSASTIGGTAPYRYTWTGITGISSGAGPHQVSPQLTSLYTVSVVDTNNCAVNPINVMVKVGAPLNVSAPDIAVCENQSTTITANVFGGGQPYMYAWDNGVNTQTQNISINQTDTHYVVTVTDGCSTPATDTAFVTVNLNPSGSIDAFPRQGCAPLLVNFVAISNGGVRYYWNYGNNGSIAATTADTINYIYTNSGNYDVSLTIVNLEGCSTLVDSFNYINVYPRPVADFSMDPNPTSEFSPKVQFTDLSYFNIASWSWNFADTGSSVLQSPTYIFPSVAGDYLVSLKVIDTNGCVDSTSKLLVVKPEWAFYVPNSFIPDGDGRNDGFGPKGVGISENNYSFLIFNRWGENIFETSILFEPWDGTYEGTIVQEDTYVWKASFIDINGDEHHRVGRVTLIK